MVTICPNLLLEYSNNSSHSSQSYIKEEKIGDEGVTNNKERDESKKDDRDECDGYRDSDVEIRLT